ncbi:MAG: hypothetical protein Q8O13_03145 [Candidatus Omnitrophota bacterium]|nr:hypothetical protein [Candidatus Omnitrophota bacterium]
MKKIVAYLIFSSLNLLLVTNMGAQYLVYEDKIALDVYNKAFLFETKDNLIAVIKDKEEDAFKRAAAINILREKFFTDLSPQEKIDVQEMLRKVFRRGGSSFIKIEIAYALCQLDRQKYFKDMAPFLIRRIDNENNVVSERAFDRIENILNDSDTSREEAKIVLGLLKKNFNPSEDKESKEFDLRYKEKMKLFVWASKKINN